MSYTIYGKGSCEYCIKAKELLRELELAYIYIDIGINPQCKEFVLNAGAETVPQIFDGFKHIGGYEDLVKYVN